MLMNRDVTSPTFWTDNGLNPLASYLGPGEAAKYFFQEIDGISLRPMAVVHDEDWTLAKLLKTAGEKIHAFYLSARTAKDNAFKLLVAGGMLRSKAAEYADGIYFGVTCLVAKLIYFGEDFA